MANMNIQATMFFGKEENVKNFYKELKKVVDENTTNEYADTFVIFKNFTNMSEKEILGMNSGYACGTVLDLNEPFATADSPEWAFQITLETKWRPIIKGWKKVLEKYDINSVTISDSECFVNTDTEGRFFKDKYYIDYCHEGYYYDNYFQSLKDFLACVKEKLNIEAKTFTEVQNQMDELAENSEDDEAFYNVYEFEICKNEEACY